MPIKNIEERVAYHKAYRELHKARLVEEAREWRLKNADTLKETKHADYLANMDAYKARAKAHRERNADAIKARRATPEYREQRNAARRARYASDEIYREEVLLHQKSERVTKGDVINARRREANTRKPFWLIRFERALNKAYFNGAQIVDRPALRSYYQQIFTQPSAICMYCRGLFPIREIVLDHKQPYALGGCHEVSNLIVSCHPCNRAKHTTPFDKWTAKTC